MGHVELLDDLNHLKRQSAWYLFLQVGQARVGSVRSFIDMILLHVIRGQLRNRSMR